MKTHQAEHYTSIGPDEMEHKAALCSCRLVREGDGRVKLMMCGPHQKTKVSRKKNRFVLLTAYLDLGGDLQFHGGVTERDFGRDVGKRNIGKVLRRFWIEGRIVKEDGETEPIRVSPPYGSS
jgi:hypothetical protein